MKGERGALITGFFAAATSGVAILLYAFGWISLAGSLTFIAPLTVIVFAALMVWARRARQDIFLTRLMGGLAAGGAGLLAYDFIRLGILYTDLVPFNPFRPIEVYGLWILDRQRDDWQTKTAGWIFHVWNGMGFAVMYTMLAGPGRVLWGLGWAMMLESLMLATYPSMFKIALAWPLISVSLIGHAAYGLALGWVAQRSVRL